MPSVSGLGKSVRVRSGLDSLDLGTEETEMERPHQQEVLHHPSEVEDLRPWLVFTTTALTVAALATTVMLAADDLRMRLSACHCYSPWAA